MSSGEVTQLLARWRGGSREALDRLLPLVYDELRRLARRHMASERRDHTLQTTALLNEACVRLIGAEVDWQDRAHFFAIAGRSMRRILVDHARAHRSAKRGGDHVRVPLDDAMQTALQRPWDLCDVDLALQRLETEDERKARAVELRFFGGLQIAEIAEVLGTTRHSVDWDLRLAKAWLRRELGRGHEQGADPSD